ncbi:TetR/AcrR family transcriptional regulator [Propioniferax innocua]|uniref:TetR family transcriptional regulator n=1 Tax=Propioniferax innocua TaxID=1753 RepID=A0A542ZQH2_9ACTN|nr:TetR/AcrR family transcriptional regulator [Propioniferax innocua]TQL62603.1 TetR family transcriptional regulator [Propioniferax innocua]
MSQRRTQLLIAAARLFAHYGFRKTSVEEVTRSAGVSKGAFYLEFQTKEDLFREVVTSEFCAYLNDAEERILADQEGGRLSRIYHHSVEALLDRPFLRALYTDADGTMNGILHTHGTDRYHPRILLGAEFIAQMQANGLLREDASPEETSHTLSVLTLGPLLAEPLLRFPESPSLEQTLKSISRMIVASLETYDGDPAAGKRAFHKLKSQMVEALKESRPDGSHRSAPGS